MAGEGDHFRTRLTHTLEVTRIARTLARTLALDEDLAEAIALAHDLGHPPFGHAGERALDAAMASYGGFDHNAQTFRIVATLERRYPRFDGLNLTWETLEGIAKHNGPLTDRAGAPLAGHATRRWRFTSAAWTSGYGANASLEAQVAALADDIAYAGHDIDDGLRAGLLNVLSLGELDPVGPVVKAISAEYPGLERPRLAHELSRRLLTLLINDAVAETRRRLAKAAPASSDDVREAATPLAAFSAEVAKANATLKEYLLREFYRTPRVLDVMRTGEVALRRLFERYLDDPTALPPEWRTGLDRADPAERARRVADFLAGQTDGYARHEHIRLFDEEPEFG